MRMIGRVPGTVFFAWLAFGSSGSKTGDEGLQKGEYAAETGGREQL